MRILFLFSISILFYSCTDFDRQKQIEKIDSLLSSIDSIVVVQEEQEIANYNEISANFNELEDQLLLINDTITLGLALMIDDFKHSKKSLIPYLDLNELIDTNVLQSRSTLEALKKDIEGAHGSRKTYDEDIVYEGVKVDSIRSYLESLILVKNEILDGYDAIYNDLNSEIEKVYLSEGTEFDE